jgi:hypothetical protein
MPAYVGSHNKTSGESIMTLINMNLNKKDAGTGKKEGHLMLLIFLLMRMVKYQPESVITTAAIFIEYKR